MKQLIASAVLVAFFALTAMAQESKVVTGYLVDKMCASGMVKKGPAEAMLKASKHTRDCALEPDCAKAGYGVVSDGKFIKFDEKGDVTAKDYLTKSKQKDHIMVEVTGTMEGDTLAVNSLKESKMPAKKPVKKMK